MRETRPFGLEGGGTNNRYSLSLLLSAPFQGEYSRLPIRGQRSQPRGLRRERCFRVGELNYLYMNNLPPGRGPGRLAYGLANRLAFWVGYIFSRSSPSPLAVYKLHIDKFRLCVIGWYIQSGEKGFAAAMAELRTENKRVNRDKQLD